MTNPAVTNPAQGAAEPAVQTVVHVFQELLGVAPIDADEDFFELGGHSLLAQQLIARVNARLDTRLELAALFDGQATPARLAGLAVEGMRAPSRALVVLRGGGAVPVACVPPAGGDLVGFHDLSLALDPSCTMWGFAAPPLPTPDAAQGVAELAALYAAETERPGVDGPLVLLGWSMGGLVAHETARLLAERGRSVAHLILVDTYSADVLPQDDDFGIAEGLAEQIGRLTGRPIDPARLRGRPLDEVLRAARAIAADAGVDLVDADWEQLRRSVDLVRAHVRAAREFRPGRFDGPVTLIQAEQTDAAMRAAAFDVWRSACPGLDRPTVLPGDHFSLFRTPDVYALASVIAAVAGRQQAYG
ncbi:thioesterase domain-containing protein [Dactylosporangium cerinum]|uniref:Thioesterase domain-containing protein n=1 Tax=Dactylosporangium cerinum TaxID=1434730 RepID=A0ABV9W1U2_9ACTN